uniref:Ig-like domain-containing protein n=1 Tax=Salarias fasciatus TaxID=181472 RepID=A0A672GEK4_SALFA
HSVKCLCTFIFSYSLHLLFLVSLPGSEVIRKIVKEDQDALLSCSLDGTNIAEDVFDWRTDGSSRHEVFLYAKGRSHTDRLPGQADHFKDRVFHFPEQLAVGNASIVIRKTQVTDSGNYTCYFPFHEPRRRAQYELIVGECPHSDGDRQLCISRSDWFKLFICKVFHLLTCKLRPVICDQ